MSSTPTSTPQHLPYPSIAHFQKSLTAIQKDKLLDRRRLTLHGTVKLHGTHGDMVYRRSTDTLTFQSRNRVVSQTCDNCGFAAFLAAIGKESITEKLIQPILDATDGNPEIVMLAGEFCGPKVQGGVALTRLPNMFVWFGVGIDGSFVDPARFKHLEIPDRAIYNIFRAETYVLELDRDDRQALVPKLVEITAKVEKECPFAKSFGVSGVGEGVVWVVDGFYDRPDFYFKVKGEAHTSSRVTTLHLKTPEEITALQNVKDFAAKCLPSARLQQGLDYLREQDLDATDMKNLPVFIKWILADVGKEEDDEIEMCGLDRRMLRKELSVIAREFYHR
ncbi:hypothetical protein HKX48_000144 [Thoreauomyces humboldtii]|nr:hypothetical protein HKX48_000144 [Thoreauomyces humboldtii]